MEVSDQFRAPSALSGFASDNTERKPIVNFANIFQRNPGATSNLKVPVM